MSNYLIELALIHIALMLGYWFFLKNEHQYAKMRFYLIASTLLALTIPLLKLPKLLFGGNQPIHALTMEAIQPDTMAIATVSEIESWNYHLLVWIYLVISIFFLVRLCYNLLYMVYLEHKSIHQQFNGVQVRKLNNIRGSFTFFNWIFLSDDIDTNRQDYQVILKHEQAHADLGHTYDLILLELFKVCFWWLPSTWFINKEIRKIHEYQADTYALKYYNVNQYSTVLISTALMSNGLSLASSFHDGLILKRLNAMKQQAKILSPWKLALLSVLAALLFIVFACSEELDSNSEDNIISEQDVFTVVEELPEFEGGMDAFYKYIASEIKYPLEARNAGIEGQVDVQFVVEKDGSLSGVKAIKGIGAGCDDEAIRVIQSANTFKPGSQIVKPVRVRMTLPVIFKLNHSKTNPDQSTQGMIILDKLETSNPGKLKVETNYANGTWSGKVFTEDGEGLPGANVVVAGTNSGAVTNLAGFFEVKADQSKDLLVSFVGYKTVKVEGKP
ncbi:MAG: hypothetical protein DHS20C17_04530 [Cyclobacteriaceae bacterium]|nr:MAG: hypothetical protein DHS20C17_04530 [Cyclobacteriaceae bacterium]